ncbi:3-hydroxyacyl-ACP dehydratase FabZ [Mammaliicoccus sciuri]|uniref:3-hydroxyacyl-ACP dehydratase FabZ n=1 Tax=Mammaliicoccus sciuri TaxID=1296 RepID=UPI002DB6AD32|nr:3-hydroxyacyl-ACP dehydratase FabZ [Mammaliicoccus sciuri]MEB7067184.1 3-hydroxyacyl-ACP dehydratase FabZ [Mammaliicoccus sciuri]
METIYDFNEIKKIIPHRYPFLLLDRIVELEDGKRCVGIKQVAGNEPFFQGHFPDYAVMPGVLIVEALAQTGAVAMLRLEENQGKLAMFAGIDKCRFKKQVIPGDTLRLEVEINKIKGPIGKGTAKATVDGEVACSCEISFAIVDQ